VGKHTYDDGIELELTEEEEKRLKDVKALPRRNNPLYMPFRPDPVKDLIRKIWGREE